MPYYDVKPGDTLLTDEYIILVQNRDNGGWTRYFEPYDEEGMYLLDQALEVVRKESSHYRPMKVARITFEVVS